MGIMEKNTETTGIIGVIQGYIFGLYGDNGEEHGNYRDYRGYLGVYIGFIWG